MEIRKKTFIPYKNEKLFKFSKLKIFSYIFAEEEMKEMDIIFGNNFFFFCFYLELFFSWTSSDDFVPNLFIIYIFLKDVLNLKIIKLEN